MKGGPTQVLVALSLLTLLALGGFLYLSAQPEGSTAKAEMENSTPSNEAKDSDDTSSGPPPPPRTKQRNALSPANAEEEGSTPESPPPECVEDSDCRGPRQADCMQARCKDHECTVDLSACECTSNAECDDRDPCTRDLCFARTQACIHIEQDCEEKHAR